MGIVHRDTGHLVGKTSAGHRKSPATYRTTPGVGGWGTGCAQLVVEGCLNDVVISVFWFNIADL